MSWRILRGWGASLLILSVNSHLPLNANSKGDLGFGLFVELVVSTGLTLGFDQLEFLLFVLLGVLFSFGTVLFDVLLPERFLFLSGIFSGGLELLVTLLLLDNVLWHHPMVS